MCSTASEQSRPNNRNQEAIAQRFSPSDRLSAQEFRPSGRAQEQKSSLVIHRTGSGIRIVSSIIKCVIQFNSKPFSCVFQSTKKHLNPFFDFPLHTAATRGETHAYTDSFKRDRYVLLLFQPFVVWKNIKGDVESQFSRLYPKHSREIRHLHIVKARSQIRSCGDRGGAFSFMGC